MPVLDFGEWLPDLPDLNNPGSLEATNVVPAARGYAPQPDLAPITDALDSRALGAKQGVSNELNVTHYAGDNAKLYENVDQVWTDRSKAGGYNTAAEERWEFAQWKNKMLAVNFSDNPQQITFSGANFSDLTTAFQARHIAIVGDFVVVGSTNDTSDGEVPDRVRWSAIDDETDWTVSAATLSDFQDLKTGSVQRVMGGEFGVVLQTRAIWRMTFIGSPTVFQFDEVVPGIGVIAPGAAVRLGNFVYILSEQGFIRLRNGTTAERIGSNKIDSFVLGDVDNDYLPRISAAHDHRRVYWAYPGVGNSGGTPNKIIIYDFTLDRWSILEKDVELIWSATGVGYTLEELDSISTNIDTLSLSLDSNAWKGGKRVNLVSFDTDNKNGFWDSATNMSATIKTAERELTPGRQTNLGSFAHVVDGGAVTAKVGTRQSQSDAISFGPSLTERATNRFNTRSNARYHQFEFTITGDWDHAIGMQIEKDDLARGGRRGR